MVRGTKRSAAAAAAAEETSSRSTKVAKTDKNASNGSKSVPSAEDFKAKALPLHVNLTHTPPSIVSEDEVATTAAEDGPTIPGLSDIGFIDKLSLLPTTFSTGSYGWKGNKRVVVELQNGESGEGGKEKVTVMLTINATVLNSKPGKPKSKKSKKSKDEEGEEDEEEEISAEAEEKED